MDYLNERPSFVLFLASRGQDVTKEPIEIYGSDPYILGGHTMGGFWVDEDRMTTIPGLFAAGETAGGNPNKFVGGCAVEGKIAARGALKYIAKHHIEITDTDQEQVEIEKQRVFAPLLRGGEFCSASTPGSADAMSSSSLREESSPRLSTASPPSPAHSFSSRNSVPASETSVPATSSRAFQ